MVVRFGIFFISYQTKAKSQQSVEVFIPWHKLYVTRATLNKNIKRPIFLTLPKVWCVKILWNLAVVYCKYGWQNGYRDQSQHVVSTPHQQNSMRITPIHKSHPGMMTIAWLSSAKPYIVMVLVLTHKFNFPILTPSKSKFLSITIIESRIKEHPHEWIWIHRRWKTRPPIASMG